MKKLFSKIETKIENTAKETNNYVGKVFLVGRTSVTVEEVLAEGNLLNLTSILINRNIRNLILKLIILLPFISLW